MTVVVVCATATRRSQARRSRAQRVADYNCLITQSRRWDQHSVTPRGTPPKS
ncbi:MAG: hypothetical protein J2P16_12895 [Mycobacterium sp.]|nr:hypothetical protein [Mycobacterium sp.]